MSDERIIDRFVDIESKLAHQEHTIAELNDVVTKHQETLMQLERLYASLTERMASLAEAAPGGSTADERPPHY